MKKINSRIYRSLMVSGVAFGTLVGISTTVQAKHIAKKATVKKVTKNKHESTMKVIDTSGYIYKNYDLKTKVGSLKKFKNKLFKTRYVYSVKLANGQYVLVNKVKSGKISGYIETVDLKTVSTKKATVKSNNQSDDQQNNSNNATDDSFTSSSTDNGDSNAQSNANQDATSSDSTDFTAQDMAQIDKYKAQAQSIGNGASSQDIYSSQPVISGTFNPGQLNPTYIKNSIDWINFFRQMVGQPAVFDNTGWDQDAQYGAAAMDAANNASGTNKLSHGLVDFTKPSFISDADWQRGAEATNDGNISSGIDSPYDVVTNFLNDGFNIDPSEGPGHREWLLGNIDQVGIGKSGQYNTYKLFESGMNNSYTASQPINFPGKGVFPIDLVQNTVWSISVPGKYDGSTPTVSIHDNTSNTDVSVSGINSSGTTVDSQNVTTFGYGFLNTNVWFTPDANAIQVNHSYTITVSGLPGMSSPYSYTTKLFDLGIASSN